MLAYQSWLQLPHDATPSELEKQTQPDPRVAKAQPWALRRNAFGVITLPVHALADWSCYCYCSCLLPPAYCLLPTAYCPAPAPTLSVNIVAPQI